MDTDIIIVLNINNFTEWHKQIKGLARKIKVQNFLDPEQVNQILTYLRPPNFNTYNVIVTTIISVVEDTSATQTTVTQKIIAISELSTTQKEDYREKYTNCKINKFYIN